MARDPHAYKAYYPLSYWSAGIPMGPGLTIGAYLGSGPGLFRDRVIAVAILGGGVMLLGWAGAAMFARIVALCVDSAGITVRLRRRVKKTAVVLPWSDIEYLVIWHDDKTTSLSVQPRGGTPQPMRMPQLMPPKNYVTIKAKALDEQHLLSAVTHYGPAVQVVDGNTGSPVTGSPYEPRSRHMSRRSRFQELSQTWQDNLLR